MSFQRGVSVLAQLAASRARRFYSLLLACGASSRTFSAIASPNRTRTLNTADAAMRYRHKYQVNKSPLCAHCAQASWRFDSTQTTQRRVDSHELILTPRGATNQSRPLCGKLATEKNARTTFEALNPTSQQRACPTMGAALL